MCDTYTLQDNTYTCHRLVRFIRSKRISATSLWHLYVLARQYVYVSQTCDTCTFKTYKCHKSVTLRLFLQDNTYTCHRPVTRIRSKRISVTSLWHVYVVARQYVYVSQTCDTYTFNTYKCHKSVALIRFCKTIRMRVTDLWHLYVKHDVFARQYVYVSQTCDT